MKKLAIILALATLAGCAAPQPGPANYGTRGYYGNEWQTVSVTPVPLGTGARAAAAGENGTVTTSQPDYYPPQQAGTTVVQPVYTAPPVYVSPPVYAAPMYAPAPVYVAPQPSYWWPPISIGLGFNWRHWSGGGHGGGWHGGHGGYGHR
jgi:hypothetical protein